MLLTLTTNARHSTMEQYAARADNKCTPQHTHGSISKGRTDPHSNTHTTPFAHIDFYPQHFTSPTVNISGEVFEEPRGQLGSRQPRQADQAQGGRRGTGGHGGALGTEISVSFFSVNLTLSLLLMYVHIHYDLNAVAILPPRRDVD
jgi:hypothetical protein